MRNQFDKILNWYFTKNALPYWCIFLIDCATVMFSGVFTYWLFTNTQTLYDDTLIPWCVLRYLVCQVFVCFTHMPAICALLVLLT